MRERFLVWWVQYSRHVGICVGLILVGILCFEAGFLLGRTKPVPPAVLSLPERLPETTESQGVTMVPIAAAPSTSLNNTTETCPYVASKNSHKYHAATCAVVKRIKVENRICFSSQEEAKQKGYVPSCLK